MRCKEVEATTALAAALEQVGQLAPEVETLKASVEEKVAQLTEALAAASGAEAQVAELQQQLESSKQQQVGPLPHAA